jgi:hypothetical protein
MILDKDKKDRDTWQDLTLGRRGRDEFAQHSTNKTHHKVRDELLKVYAQKGWKFVKKSSLI